MGKERRIGAKSPLEVVRAVYASHEERDTPGLVDLLAPDVEWFQAEGHPYAGDGPWRGPGEVVERVVTPINGDWESFITEVREFVELTDGRVIVFGRYSGRYRSTQNRVDAPVCTVYTIVDGLITRWEQFTNTAAIRAAMECPMADDGRANRT